ncbi:SDR family NAD(P)-dependent oxidoreductase [Halioxenophilus aromaticivorans]|uniref:SDR family NAD(P)-dependent oxidoreductase n=1 Tax=Halioxenophilus aromaticivorans TaxID=1306992 RepID=A0AAV3U9R7_9ALTE
MNERADFTGQVAIVTGAGRGLGKSYAILLASRGAKVVVNDIGSTMRGDNGGENPAQEVVDEITNAGGEAVASTDSVATMSGAQAIVNTAISRYGKVDILINNAGNVRYGSIVDLSLEDFNSVLDVHLKGAFHMVKSVFPTMIDSAYGRIILTASISGLYGLATSVNYGVAKAGMIGLNNVVALEGAEHNIKSNIILPGAVTRMSEGIDTSQFPPMPPELVAPVVGYLAHQECAISGELLVSMAGRVARAMIAETQGVFQKDWTIEQVAQRLGDIRNTEDLWLLAPCEDGFNQHMIKSFAMVSSNSE